MAEPPRERFGRGPRRIALIVAIGELHIAFRREIALQQPDLINRPGQRAYRKSAARIADQKNPVTLAVMAGEKTIGAADLAVDAASLGDIGKVHPVFPLHARLVVQRTCRGKTIF